MKSMKTQEEINETYRHTNIDNELYVQRTIINKSKRLSDAINLATVREMKRSLSMDLLDLLFLMALIKEIEKLVDRFYVEISSLMLDMIRESIFINYQLPFLLAEIDVIPLTDYQIQTIMTNEHIKMPIFSQIQNSKRDLLRNISNNIYDGALNGKSSQQIGIQNSNLVYNKTIDSIGGEAGRLIRINRTEMTRIRSHAKEYATLQLVKKNINVTKKWVYTYESKVPRQHHLASNGKLADKDGYFTITGLRTKGPGLFGLASEDINCRCDTKIFVR